MWIDGEADSVEDALISEEVATGPVGAEEHEGFDIQILAVLRNDLEAPLTKGTAEGSQPRIDRDTFPEDLNVIS